MNWTITSLVVTPNDGSYTDVVVTAFWSCTATQVANGVTYTASTSNSTTLPAPAGSFTPYSQLTQQQVLGWVWSNGVDQSVIEAAVNADLQNQIATLPPLPWAN
jgi:hypothetical protein